MPAVVLRAALALRRVRAQVPCTGGRVQAQAARAQARAAAECRRQQAQGEDSSACKCIDLSGEYRDSRGESRSVWTLSQAGRRGRFGGIDLTYTISGSTVLVCNGITGRI